MGDRVIWVVYFFLCVISLVEVYSAGSSLSYKTGAFWRPLVSQACFLLGGTVIVVAIHRVPCRMFKAIPIILIPISFILLAITTVSGLSRNGANRWFEFFGIQFQPSELAKGAVVICVALLLSRAQRPEGADKAVFSKILWIAGIGCGLIFTENLSTAFLLFVVVLFMMIIGRVSMKQIGKLLGVLAIAGTLFVTPLLLKPKDMKLPDIFFLHRFETWSNRLTAHFEGSKNDAADNPLKVDLDKDAQVIHAHIAIARSNGIGRMPGNSVERDFLSQAFSDFIYAIIIEETGIWGGTVVVLLYIILLFRAGRISSRCERNFPPFLAMGLTLLMVTQAMMNMLVAVGIAPVTGQTLPLISRGGTSTLVNCAYIGMILSVSRYARQVKEPQHTNFDGKMDDIKHE